MIAGPNGSGKSTLTSALAKRGFEFGEYLNADDIAKGLSGSAVEIVAAAQAEVRLRRDAALAGGRSYSFETVMSHPSHIAHLRSARDAGFETRLIFVATERPSINLGRVANRVLHGGHDVPGDRIEARYHRCLANLPDAIAAADNSLIFDNSRPETPFRLLAIISHNVLRFVDVKKRYMDQQSLTRAGLQGELEDGVEPMDLPRWWLEILPKIKPFSTFTDGRLR
jgi:predicted ABC-type ATPase